MKTSLLSLFAGTVFLAGAAGASAGEPVTLASAELDAISAGVQDNTANVSAFIAQSNTATVTQTATATASGNNSWNSATAYNTSDIYQSNRNYGDVSLRASIRQSQ